MLCKFSHSLNDGNDCGAEILQRIGRVGARALLLIGLCGGWAGPVFAQATADTAVLIQGTADAPAGQPVQYNVTITNAGPANANGAPFNITFMPPLVAANATCINPFGGAVCPPLNGAGPYTGNIPALPPNSGFMIQIMGGAPGGTVTATVRADPPPGTNDPNNGNNQATTNTLPVALQYFDVQ